MKQTQCEAALERCLAALRRIEVAATATKRVSVNRDQIALIARQTIAEAEAIRQSRP